MRIAKFEDNLFNFTFVLDQGEFEHLKREGGVTERPYHGPFFLRRFWRTAAKVRALLDLAVQAGTDRSERKHGPHANPRKDRFHGKGAESAALEQALVATVSAWELFLRETIRYVLNNASFVGRLAGRNDEPIKAMAREFRLTDDILLEFATKGFNPDKVMMGDSVVNSGRIRWQNLDDCKRVVRLLFPDMSLPNLAKNWQAIVRLFEDRHKIVHDTGEDTRVVEEPDFDEEGEVRGTVMAEETFELIENYGAKSIEEILDDMLAVAESLHNRLFARYVPDS